MERVGRRNVVLEDLKDDGAQQRAPETSCSAKDKHHERFGRPFETDAIEADDAGVDRSKGSPDSRDGPRYAVHDDEPRIHPSSDHPCTQAIVLDRPAK